MSQHFFQFPLILVCFFVYLFLDTFRYELNNKGIELDMKLTRKRAFREYKVKHQDKK